jgi:putative ABC transport system permease protein
MKLFDLVRLVFGNLSRRKARVALTAIGVVIGTAAVVILVSLAIGLQKNANEQLYGIGDLSQIQVSPTFGNGGPSASAPIKMGGGGGGGGGSGGSTEQHLLTNDALAQLRALSGVESVIPQEFFYSGMVMKLKRLEGGSGIRGVGAGDLNVLGLSAAQGTTALARGTVIVGAMVPNNFADPRLRPGQDPPPPPDLYDQQLLVTLIKYDSDGNEIRKSLSLHVTGVLAQTSSDADYTVFMTLDEVKSMNEWATGTKINYNKTGYNQVVVKLSDPKAAVDIAKQITDMGFQAFTPQSFVQGINSFYQVLQIIFGGVGAIALLVAAIGIANTMTMSILERTREIGLMKAVGATNRDVLAIFLGEASGIGFLGGLGGVIIGWLAGQAINVLAIVYLAGQASQQGGMPPSVAVYTPIWLPVFALIFSTFIGMISGLYPALRAATMIPVMALKYE